MSEAMRPGAEVAEQEGSITELREGLDRLFDKENQVAEQIRVITESFVKRYRELKNKEYDHSGDPDLAKEWADLGEEVPYEEEFGPYFLASHVWTHAGEINIGIVIGKQDSNGSRVELNPDEVNVIQEYLFHFRRTQYQRGQIAEVILRPTPDIRGMMEAGVSFDLKNQATVYPQEGEQTPLSLQERQRAKIMEISIPTFDTPRGPLR